MDTFFKIKEMMLVLACFLLGALSLTINKGYMYPTMLVLLLSFTAILDKQKSILDADDKKIIGVLLLYVVVGLIDTVFHKEPLSNFDLFFRYLIGAWFICYLCRFSVRSDGLWLGYIVGALYVGSYALYAKFYLDMPRVRSAHLNEIHFGNLSMMLGMFCLVGIFWARQYRYSKWLTALLLLGFLFGLIASLLSGTRSGWVGLPFLAIMIYYFFRNEFPKRYVQSGLAGILAVVTLAVVHPETDVLNRIKMVEHDIEKYWQGDANTSIGLRFDMWKTGLLAFSEKPLLGWGETEFDVFQEKMVVEHNLHPEILGFNHLHNQYIEELAIRGLVGFVALLLLFLVPLRMFLKRMNSSDLEVKALAAAGCVAVICMIDFCLTQAMLRITSGVMFFVYNMVFIWALMRSRERDNAHQLAKANTQAQS